MKILFLVTENKIETLLIGVHFTHNSETITLINEGKNINFNNLNEILVNSEKGFVVFTDNLNKCKEFQEKIREIYSKGG